MADSDLERAVATVERLTHRVGTSHARCTCVECRAVRVVCALARERIQTIESNNRKGGFANAC